MSLKNMEIIDTNVTKLFVNLEMLVNNQLLFEGNMDNLTFSLSINSDNRGEELVVGDIFIENLNLENTANDNQDEEKDEPLPKKTSGFFATITGAVNTTTDFVKSTKGIVTLVFIILVLAGLFAFRKKLFSSK